MSWDARVLREAIGYEDIRSLARRRLPRVMFDFIDGGAGAELTIRANRAVFDQVALLPRQANPPASIDLAATVLDDVLHLPVLLAPCGSARIVHPRGEHAVANAAARAGTVYVVPHLGSTSCEELRQAGAGKLWYQIYKYGGRQIAEPAIRRAWDAGYRKLVVTVDNSRTVKERDVRNGLGALLGGNRWRALPHFPQFIIRPRWLMGFLGSPGATQAPNAILPDGRCMQPADIVAAASLPESYFQWSDFAWLRSAWPGPLIVKGILTAADARRSVDCGASGIIVSNHGGRVLDGVETSLRALPEVIAAAPDNIPVMLDGGVRRATDIVKALCLGARAVLIGRPYMFALSYGEPGVSRLLSLLETDLRQTLATLGCSSVAELNSGFIRTPADWDR